MNWFEPTTSIEESASKQTTHQVIPVGKINDSCRVLWANSIETRVNSCHKPAECYFLTLFALSRGKRNWRIPTYGKKRFTFSPSVAVNVYWHRENSAGIESNEIPKPRRRRASGKIREGKNKRQSMLGILRDINISARVMIV